MRYRADEMFVILGVEIARRIANRRYCGLQHLEGCNLKEDLFDTNYGGTSLGLWLTPYTDVNVVAINAMGVHKRDVALYARVNVTRMDVCKRPGPYLFYHKASPEQMQTIYGRHGHAGHGRERWGTPPRQLPPPPPPPPPPPLINQEVAASHFDADASPEQAVHALTGATGVLFSGTKIRAFPVEKLRFADDEWSRPQARASSNTTPPLPSASNRNNGVPCKHWAVVTTINNVTEAVRRVGGLPGYCLVVVGDKKGPRSYNLPASAPGSQVFFLDATKQQQMAAAGNALAKHTPWNHFGRKNIGYLFAVQHGAMDVFDFDDDNLLLPQEKMQATIPRGDADINDRIANSGSQVDREGQKEGRRRPASHALNLQGVPRPPPTLGTVVMAAEGSGKRSGSSGAFVSPIPDPDEAITFCTVSTDFATYNPYFALGSNVSGTWPRGFPLPHYKQRETTRPCRTMPRPTLAATAGKHRAAVDADRDQNANVHRNTAGGVETTASANDNAFQRKNVAVWQLAANHDPDVDAIYRLTRPLPFVFAARGPTVVIPAKVLAPYNSQSSVHTQQALWALLLPTTVPGRVSDIWRGYAAQRLFWNIGAALAFVPPRVEQIRNAHTYIADLQSELDLYLKSERLVDFLRNEWTCNAIRPGATAALAAPLSLPTCMEQLWVALYERDYLEVEDVVLVQVWLEELVRAQYKFPHFQQLQ